MDRSSRIRSWALIALGSGVLLGWIVDVDVLKSLLPGLASMKVNTAIAFIFVGVAFLRGPRWSYVAAVIGALTLLQYVFGINLGIDTVLFDDPDSVLTSSPGRMSPITAAGLVAVAGGFAKRPGLAVGFFVALVAFVFLTLAGYLFGVKPFFGASVFTTGLAVHTFLGFLLVIPSARRTLIDRGAWRIPQGRFSKAQFETGIVVGLVLPLVIGTLAHAMVLLGWIGVGLQLAIVATATAAALATIGWRSSWALDRVERETETLAEELAVSNTELERRVQERTKQLEAARFRMTQILHAAGEGIYGVDVKGKATFCNPAALAMLGRTKEIDVYGRHMYSLLRHDEGGPVEDDPTRYTLRQGQSKAVDQDTFRRADGSIFSVAYSCTPILVEGETAGAVVVFRNITEDLRDAEALRSTTDALIQSNRDLESYASMAGHDLQAPLRHVAGFAEILAGKTDQLDGEGQLFLKRMGQSVERMQQLIDSLLAFSRVASSAPAWEEVPLNELMEDVMAPLAALLQEVGGELQTDDLPLIRGDSVRLRQVFQNLLTNSIRYRATTRPLHIAVRYSLEADKHVIRVADNGKGFDPQYAERMFGMFQRLEEKNDAGVGLGLAIVRRIVDQHGGTIEAVGKIDVGATFIITLPVH